MLAKSMSYRLIPLLLVLSFAVLSCTSQRRGKPGLVEGRLSPCPGSPNCVSSEEEGSSQIDPLSFKGTPEQAWDCLRGAVVNGGGKIEEDASPYLWATFRTKLFRFVDDIEFRMDVASQIVHVRSASRVGYSDLGANRKRVETLRSSFAKEQQRPLEQPPSQSSK